MLRKGIYRTEKPETTVEKHGGVKVAHDIYWYLCFYIPKLDVGLYGTKSKNYFDPFYKNTIRLKGEITEQVADTLSFYIDNIDTGAKIRFKGKIKDETLIVSYFHEDDAEHVFEGVFRYVDNAEPPK